MKMFYLLFLIQPVYSQWYCAPQPSLKDPDNAWEPFTDVGLQYGPFPLHKASKNYKSTFCTAIAYSPRDLSNFVTLAQNNTAVVGIFLSDAVGDLMGYHVEEIVNTFKSQYKINFEIPPYCDITYMSLMPLTTIKSKIQYRNTIGPIHNDIFLIEDNFNCIPGQSQAPTTCFNRQDAVLPIVGAEKYLYDPLTKCISPPFNPPTPDTNITPTVSPLLTTSTSTVTVITVTITTTSTTHGSTNLTTPTTSAVTGDDDATTTGVTTITSFANQIHFSIYIILLKSISHLW